MFAGLQGWHLVIIIVLALLLFGAPKLPGLARSIGQSLRIFKSEVRQMKDEDPIITSVITQNQSSSVDIASAVADAVKSQLKSNYGANGSNSGRQNIPHVIEKNINAMNSSVSVKNS